VVKFQPRGDLVRGSVMEPIRTDGVVTALSPKPLQMAVPIAETGGRCDAWDSDFGKNYWFDVDGPWPIEPPDPVRYREGAIADPGIVNVFGQTAVKRNVFPAPANGPPAGKNLRTSLALQAWVKNVAFAKAVWIDVHVFDRTGARIAAATFGLSWQASDGGFGDLFGFNGDVYQGLTATPGSVSPRRNAWLIPYRLYYAVEDRLYTDAVLHQLEVVDDAVA
jgi:hypothetical protein